MSKYLLAYSISGQTVGVNIETWGVADLNGCPPFMVIDSTSGIPSGYTNITSIKNWHSFGKPLLNDYMVCKTEISGLVQSAGWSGLTAEEKDLAIQYHAYAVTDDVISYLVTTKGYSNEYAQAYILELWHRHRGNVILSTKQRWYYVKAVVPAYLSYLDSEDLLNSVETLAFAYNDMGRLGINYGDKKDGVMDYIESTGIYAGKGLRETNYTLLAGTWDVLIAALKAVLVNGVYTKYHDFDIL